MKKIQPDLLQGEQIGQPMLQVTFHSISWLSGGPFIFPLSSLHQKRGEMLHKLKYNLAFMIP